MHTYEFGKPSHSSHSRRGKVLNKKDDRAKKLCHTFIY
jgi:hypothetical protein